MKWIVALITSLVIVSGCSPTVDSAIRKNLPQICQAGLIAHTAFITIAVSGSLKPSLVAKEAAYYKGLEQICANPDSVNSANALVLAAQAYTAIVIALKEADK